MATARKNKNFTSPSDIELGLFAPINKFSVDIKVNEKGISLMFNGSDSVKLEQVLPESTTVRLVLENSLAHLSIQQWQAAVEILSTTKVKDFTFFERLAFFETKATKKVLEVFCVELLENKNVQRLTKKANQVLIKLIESFGIGQPTTDDIKEFLEKEEQKALVNSSKKEIKRAKKALKKAAKKTLEVEIRTKKEIEKLSKPGSKKDRKKKLKDAEGIVENTIAEINERSTNKKQIEKDQAFEATMNMVSGSLQQTVQFLLSSGIKFNEKSIQLILKEACKLDPDEVHKVFKEPKKLEALIKKQLLGVMADAVIAAAPLNNLKVPEKEPLMLFLDLFSNEELSNDFESCAMQFVSTNPKEKETVLSFVEFERTLREETNPQPQDGDLLDDSSQEPATGEVNSLASAAAHVDRQSSRRRGRETPLRRAN